MLDFFLGLKKSDIEAIRRGKIKCLVGADLSGADLRGANFSETDLRGANFSETDLRGANFSETDLRGANPSKAKLYGADLSRADLSGANLRRANLSGAILTGTCLDPKAKHEPPTTEELREAGFEIKGGWVFGWRTKESMYMGNTIYESGKTYRAPVFSVCRNTQCHPGLYLCGTRKEAQKFAVDCVQVRTRRADMLKAGSKFRTKEFTVI